MSDFKERMEAGIAAEIARRPEVRAKYEASFDGVPPDPVIVTVAWYPGEYPGLHDARATPSFTLTLTDREAPSGVHYRILDVSAPEPPSGGAWLDTVVNDSLVLLRWNGGGKAPGNIDWQSVLTAEEVASILGRSSEEGR